MSNKATKYMVDSIKLYLDSFALKDPAFKKKYENPDKNLEDCVQYIFNQVEKHEANGFHDREIFGMALHYYDEKKIDIGKAITMNVKVNRYVELTPEEIEEAKKEARDKVIKQEMTKMRKKKTVKVTKEASSVQDQKEKNIEKAKESQATLF